MNAPAPNVPNGFKTVNAADLMAGRSAPPVDFVLPGLPAGQIALLVGADGSSKSNVALQFGLAKACGIPVAGGLLPAPKATGRVLYVWGEDDIDEAHRRLSAWTDVAIARGVDPYKIRDGLANLYFLPLDGERMPLMAAGRQDSEPKPTEQMGILLEAMRGVRLTIIDPMIMFHSLSENDNGHLDTFMRLLIRMARQSGGGSVLIVHHVGQEAMLTRRDDHQAGRAGTALACATRAVWVLRGMGDDEEQAAGIDVGYGRICGGPKMSRGPKLTGKALRVTDTGVPWFDLEATQAIEAMRPKRGDKQRKSNQEPKPQRGLANIMGPGADAFDQKRKAAGMQDHEPKQDEDLAWLR